MDFDTILGLGLVVAGVLALLGKVTFALIVPVLGVVSIVLGILILGNVLEAGNVTGILLVVVGFMVHSERLRVPGRVSDAIDVVMGIVLVILGLRELS